MPLAQPVLKVLPAPPVPNKCQPADDNWSTPSSGSQEGLIGFRGKVRMA